MKIIRAAGVQFEAVRGFYHSMIDAMAGSTVYVGWKKDIYPAPEFLKNAIESGELYLAAELSEVMVIHALGVHPAYSGKGYAKALVRKAIELAREGGIKAIRLDVLEGNTPAEQLYLGFGFQYMTTLRMYYEDTGWTNFRLYELVL